MSKIIGAVEIGTSKAKALVGEVSEGKPLSIVGMATRPNEGMRKGEIIDFNKVGTSVHTALAEAEKMSGTTVDSIYLAQTGSHLSGSVLRASANVSSSDGRVSASDLQRAADEAKRRKPENGRSYVHYVRMPILLDGRPVEDPVGMIGKKVEIVYWAIEGNDSAIRANLDVANSYGLEVDDLILSSIASSTLVAGPDLKRAGVLVIDMGAGVTDLAIYRSGHVAYTGVIPVGGDHVSGDLAMGLRVFEPYAEKLKLTYGLAQHDSSAQDEKVWITNEKTIGDRAVSRKAISSIIHVRVVELFEIIAKELGDFLNPEELGAGVVLTGGASRLPGIEQVASMVLGVPARKATFPSEIGKDLAQPENATVLGLLHYALEDNRLPGQPRSKENSGILSKIGGLLGI
ncbi:MAG: cell division protein FtsA [Opitutales bacterium]|nr:cell division protein FtsA [Opitutales bacterium]